MHKLQELNTLVFFRRLLPHSHTYDSKSDFSDWPAPSGCHQQPATQHTSCPLFNSQAYRHAEGKSMAQIIVVLARGGDGLESL